MIKCQQNINFGQPSLVGRRLTVYDIVTKIYYEEDFLVAIKDYEISYKDAEDALVYCKNLNCKNDKDRIHFCDGCILRTFEEGWDFKKSDFIQLSDFLSMAKDKTGFSTGTIKELEDSEFGKVTWLIAEEILTR